jgi:hypothetical protein
MPNPLELLTKPLQIGAQIAFGAIQSIQKLLNGGEPHEERPPQREEPREKPQPPKPKSLDDATITRKVETILFRDRSVNKGKIVVNTANGVVSLRGEARTPQQIKALETKTRQVPEVQDVENLLHLPKTPARRSSSTKAARKSPVKRTTSERKTAKAEPSPKELAKTGKGRQSAPLGG